ncbi:MAG: carbohydrate binding domain-containing protein [Candidatus Omnitrophica bacterium]|nr:carbohydrate binding domain-containing protein [Candidatus Omnitrophota bacterium]
MMKLCWFYGGLLIIFVLSCVSAVVNVKNGGFESGSNQPDFWFTYKSPGTDAVFVWDNKVFHNGKYSVYIKNNGPKNAAWQTSIPVKGGATYLIKVWAKVKNGKGVTRIGLRCEDAVGNWTGQVIEGTGISGDKDWTEIFLHARVPEKAARARIFLVNSAGSGDEIWFDDVTVEETEEKK